MILQTVNDEFVNDYDYTAEKIVNDQDYSLESQQKSNNLTIPLTQYRHKLGRPKKEAKGRGRPKGSFKINKIEKPKSGLSRGRPPGSFDSQPRKPRKHHYQYRGRPRKHFDIEFVGVPKIKTNVLKNNKTLSSRKKGAPKIQNDMTSELYDMGMATADIKIKTELPNEEECLIKPENNLKQISKRTILTLQIEPLMPRIMRKRK